MSQILLGGCIEGGDSILTSGIENHRNLTSKQTKSVKILQKNQQAQLSCSRIQLQIQINPTAI